MKGKAQLFPEAGPESVVHVGAGVVVVVVVVEVVVVVVVVEVVVVEEGVVVVVVVVVEQTLVVHTFTPVESQTQVLQSTVVRVPGVQVLGGPAVVEVVVVVVVLDSD